jgi:hypothetical protein
MSDEEVRSTQEPSEPGKKKPDASRARPKKVTPDGGYEFYDNGFCDDAPPPEPIASEE